MITGTPGFVGERLTQSRIAMGLTLSALAELLSVSRQAVSQYEKGVDSPRDEVFRKIYTLFKHEPHFFLRSVDPTLLPPVLFFRSMATATKGARAKAEVRKLWIRELVNYLTDYLNFPEVNFPNVEEYPADPNCIAMEEVEVAAAGLRKAWNLGSGPIPNLVRIMEQNGAIVVRHPLDADTLDALSGWTYPEHVPYVLLNSDKDCSVRSRLDLAHELGHLILHRKINSTVLRRRELFNLVESQVFRFGASFLLPQEPFLEDLYSVSLDALKVLKQKWKVSIAMMIERLKHLAVIDAEQHRRLRINYLARHWGKQEPFDDEIPIEQPLLIPSALRMLVDQRIQSVEQISINSGFAEHWLKTLINAPTELFTPPPVSLKVLPFRKMG